MKNVSMLVFAAVSTLAFSGCKPPPVNVGIEVTDAAYCVTLEPDFVLVGPLIVDIEGNKVTICFPRTP